MDKSLLDTDLLSEILKAKNARVISRAVSYRLEYPRFTVGIVTVMEVVKGLHKKRREDEISRFIAGLPNIETLSLDESGAELAGRIYADLELAGQTIGRADPMIAATALRHSLTLVTGNQAHYERIRALGYALVLDNWRD